MVTCIQVEIGQNAFCLARVNVAGNKSGLEKIYANSMYHILILTYNQKVSEYDKEMP